MTVIVAALTGFVAGRMLWLAMRKSWGRQAFLRQNYQGVTLPTAAGVVLALTLLLVEAVRALVAGLGLGDEPGMTSLRAAALVVVLGFAVLGLLDDLVGGSGTRGFRGHIEALRRGDLTSGSIKMLGGGLIALVGAALISSGGFVSLVIDAAIIALSANLLNLFDLRPGRATKVGIGIFAGLALVSWFPDSIVPTAIVLGAAAALLLDDLHERLMLGDTGANALGAAVGLALAAQLDGTGQLVALVVLLGLNMLSEFVSFSKLIDTVPPLRILDQLGRRRPPVIDLREPRDDAEGEPLAPYTPNDEAPMPTPRRSTYEPRSSSDASRRFEGDVDMGMETERSAPITERTFLDEWSLDGGFDTDELSDDPQPEPERPRRNGHGNGHHGDREQDHRSN
jgi:UDP-GlcNAc:undecaprenyl-phosphate GlcNAc-1-phosphate transferase